MNGQMYQIACLVAAAKKAIQTNSRIEYNYLDYENSINFTFVESENYTADNVKNWFKHLKKKGLTDIKLLCPTIVKNRKLLGFSNTTESSMVCFYKDGKVTYFMANWQFDEKIQKWNILYKEHLWDNPPKGKPRFEDNTNSFYPALIDIKELASKIEFDNFVEVFASAIDALNGKDTNQNLNLPSLPEKHLNLFKAASIADVFGAMGSWNDDPSYAAYSKGLDKEYEELSNNLLKNVRQAILYSINEW